MFCNLNGFKVIFVVYTACAVQNVRSQSEQFEMITTEKLPPTIKPQTPVPITVYEASSSSPQVLRPIGTLVPAVPLTQDNNLNRNGQTSTMPMQSSYGVPQLSNINTPLREFQKYTQSDRMPMTTAKPNYAYTQLPVANNVHNSFLPSLNVQSNYQFSNLKSNPAGQSYGVSDPNMAIRALSQQEMIQNRNSRDVAEKSTTFPSQPSFNFNINPSTGWTTPLTATSNLQSSANLINVPFQRTPVQKPPGSLSPPPKLSYELVLAPLAIKPNLCSGIFAFINNDVHEKQTSAMSSSSLLSAGYPNEKYVRPSVHNLDSYCGAPNMAAGLDSTLKSAQLQSPYVIQTCKPYNPSYVGTNQNPANQAYNKPMSVSPYAGWVPYNTRSY